MDREVQRWRAETPGCATRNHLNNAGAALVPAPVLEAIQSHLRREAEFGAYEAAEEAADRIAGVYEDLGRLLGCRAANVAILENSTVAFAQSLAAFDFRPGDVIVTTRNDYTSNQLMYLSLARRRGVVVRRAEDRPEGGVDPDSLRRLAADPRCALVAVTWVPSNSGLVQPVEEIGAICESLGRPYLIDACQAVGQIPVDVTRLRCDFLAGTARKFLRGPRGIGFLYVADRALARGAYPLLVDMRGADWISADQFELVADARRFENWEFSYALVLGLGAAVRYAIAVGVDDAMRRARRLAAYARERLATLNGVRVMDRGVDLCAIVTAQIGRRHAREVVLQLRARGINTNASTRQDGLIDMDDKGATSVLRVSPHYFNTTEEIDAAVAAIASL